MTSIYSAGVDWITATTKSDKIGMAWYREYAKYQREQLLEGEKQQGWSHYGYQGVQIGACVWAYHAEHGYYAQVRSKLSDTMWTKYYPTLGNVTRIDLQVTIQLNHPLTQLCTAMYNQIKDATVRNAGMYVTNKGGTTLYIGSRQSDQYGRLYDKGVESGLCAPGYIYRYEVEIKKPRSYPLAGKLYTNFLNGQNVNQSLVAYVWNWFDGRGVTPLFKVENGVAPVVELGKKITSREKKLAWLRSQVGPTVQELLAAGLHREVRDVLGLDRSQLDKMAETAIQLPLMGAGSEVVAVKSRG